ncbi:MAG: hypothetical protein FWG94_05280 [Oscillospiraceae bacterium]|nr:hypothetical protein [Oscillospiraceae bacterium]
MATPKLILCICGAGINTSNNAKMKILELLEKEGVNDIDVKHIMIGDLGPYKNRKNMVAVWMTKVDESFGSPSVQGISFLTGSKKAKIETTKKIIALMNEIYTND